MKTIITSWENCAGFFQSAFSKRLRCHYMKGEWRTLTSLCSKRANYYIGHFFSKSCWSQCRSLRPAILRLVSKHMLFELPTYIWSFPIMTNEKITLSKQQLIFVNTCTSHHQGIINVVKRSIHMKAITWKVRTAERNVFVTQKTWMWRKCLGNKYLIEG